jgi:SAM-dependent methyltransferase
LSLKKHSFVADGNSLITSEALLEELAVHRQDYDDRPRSQSLAELSLILNLTKQQIDNDVAPAAIIDQLARSLHELRGKTHPDIWRELIPMAQRHTVTSYLTQDPFTRWSHDKPRGYSGDAQLLDFIYGHDSVADEIANATPTGKALYAYTREASSSVAVRERRDLLTKHVDEIAKARGDGAEILAIAAGHLREANKSQALQGNALRRWVALDQDPLSVGSIARDFAGTAVEAVDGSVRTVLAKPDRLGKFDFVYAAGLYDYLSRKVSVRLTEACLSMLKPGGSFLFANFAEDIVVDGYMETFMDWALLLRSKDDMWDIINATKGSGDTASVTFGANRNIVYGMITKAI